MMPANQDDLGRLISVHGISPANLQRAVFITALSFLFFLAMMFGLYLRQNIGYFLLATAFLLVYLITLFSWMMQRKTLLRIFENGLTYKNRAVTWDEISAVGEDGEIATKTNDKLMIPRSINDFGIVLNTIRLKARLS